MVLHTASNLPWHLAYCTNVHPGEDWAQTLDSLERYTLTVKRRLDCAGPFAIGLRLSARAALELAEPATLLAFQRWLDRHQCYVFTINGFPFGQFHGARVKEAVYLPDWSDPRRLEYTNRLFDLLSQLAPPRVEGSVSTAPGSFKEFVRTPDHAQRIRDNLWRCVEHVSNLCDRTGRQLCLGLEPEPLGWIEDSVETADLFGRLNEEHPGDSRLGRHLGVTYDTCHFAVEFEEPQTAIARLQQHGIRLCKVHLSNALSLSPTPASLEQLGAFADDVYLHQVIVRAQDGARQRFKDLAPALAQRPAGEWRVHFHVPLHCELPGQFNSTAGHVEGVLRFLQSHPRLCSHFEIETYTWAVLPESLRSRDVTEQIVDEYRWTLARIGA